MVNIYGERWYVNNRQVGANHRDGDLPAYIEYDENGNKINEKWFINGENHRDGDRPALIEYYYENGGKNQECWYVNSKYHRDGNLPAIITYDDYGNICGERWYVNGLYHGQR